MSKTEERRAGQREALVEAAERTIAEQGLAALKARDLAVAAGVSLGGLYNIVGDLDEVILRVAARTLTRLDAALEQARGAGAAPEEQLVAIAIAYCRFARENLGLWRALFDHRMAHDRVLPDWQAQSQWSAFSHVSTPLRALLPALGEDQALLLARTLFSAVHGVVSLGLEEKLIAVPSAALEEQIGKFVRTICAGLKVRS